MGFQNIVAIHQPATGAHPQLRVGKAVEVTESSGARPPTVLFHKKPGAMSVPIIWTAMETQKQGETGKATTPQWPFP